MPALRAMVRRQLRVNRTSMSAMATLVAINNVVQVTTYASVFPDPATREATLAGFTSNGALRALYGYPYDIGSATGWLAWRSMGFMVAVVAVWAAFITAGALRGEEEAGRAELALSHPQPRRRWFAAALLAVAIEATVLAGLSVAALAAVCASQGLMSVTACLAVGLQLLAPALVFAGVGAVTSQLLTTTRGARIAAVAVVVIALLLRTVADAGSDLAWVRWATPLGWFEELRPSGAPSPAAVAAIAVASALLVAIALRMLAIRDVGRGLLPGRDSRRPRLFLLARSWQQALRDDLPQLSMWLAGSLFYTLVLGALARTLLDLVAGDSAFSRFLGRDFAIDAFMAAAMSLVQVIVCLLVVTLMVGTRAEEAGGRLELLMATPLSRVRWLLGRAGVAAAAALVLAVVSALALGLSTMATGESVAMWPLLQAGLDCLPLIVLTAGGAVAVLAVAPRAVGFMYVPVAVAYLWEALGTAVKAPAWALDVSPFHALATLPSQPFDLAPALLITVVGAVLLATGARGFRARDLAAG